MAVLPAGLRASKAVVLGIEFAIAFTYGAILVGLAIFVASEAALLTSVAFPKQVGVARALVAESITVIDKAPPVAEVRGVGIVALVAVVASEAIIQAAITSRAVCFLSRIVRASVDALGTPLAAPVEGRVAHARIALAVVIIQVAPVVAVGRRIILIAIDALALFNKGARAIFASLTINHIAAVAVQAAFGAGIITLPVLRTLAYVAAVFRVGDLADAAAEIAIKGCVAHQATRIRLVASFGAGLAAIAILVGRASVAREDALIANVATPVSVADACGAGAIVVVQTPMAGAVDMVRGNFVTPITVVAPPVGIAAVQAAVAIVVVVATAAFKVADCALGCVVPLGIRVAHALDATGLLVRDTTLAAVLAVIDLAGLAIVPRVERTLAYARVASASGGVGVAVVVAIKNASLALVARPDRGLVALALIAALVGVRDLAAAIAV